MKSQLELQNEELRCAVAGMDEKIVYLTNCVKASEKLLADKDDIIAALQVALEEIASMEMPFGHRLIHAREAAREALAHQAEVKPLSETKEGE